jgi:hypothetical protein
VEVLRGCEIYRPTIRLATLTRNIEQLLEKPSVRRAASWTARATDIERLLTYAECCASAPRGAATDGPILGLLLSGLLTKQVPIKAYFRLITPMWRSLRPVILKNYFGPDEGGVMRLIDLKEPRHAGPRRKTWFEYDGQRRQT